MAKRELLPSKIRQMLSQSLWVEEWRTAQKFERIARVTVKSRQPPAGPMDPKWYKLLWKWNFEAIFATTFFVIYPNNCFKVRRPFYVIKITNEISPFDYSAIRLTCLRNKYVHAHKMCENKWLQDLFASADSRLLLSIRCDVDGKQTGREQRSVVSGKIDSKLRAYNEHTRITCNLSLKSTIGPCDVKVSPSKVAPLLPASPN